MFRLSLLPLMVLVTTVATGADQPVRLLELRDHVLDLSEDNMELRLRFVGVTSGGNVQMTLSRGHGAWQAGTARTPGFNQATHHCDSSDLTVVDGRIQGPLRITIRPDRWVPTDGEEREVVCTLDLQLDTATDDPQRWRVAGSATGTLINPDGSAGEAYEATVEGEVVRPVAADAFNRGSWDDGLRLAFDMGSQRRNWNHHRMARLAFSEPRDWSSYAGLRVRVRSDAPRYDAAVTIWLQEDDGCWYYLQNAVPLIDENNVAELRFEDFTEAEWVSPGPHVDENFRLDRDRIREFGIGVVNPLGVGPVSFVLESVEGLPATAQPEPAQLVVSGQTMTVNHVEMVPVGLFGGYHPFLPERFRPGTQRAYHTLPRGGPTKPQMGEAFIIDMWGDRTQPAPLLTNRNWRQQLIDASTDYATRAKEAPEQHVLEFWNEPYLNWARGRLHYNPRYFDQTKAVDGGEVFSINADMVIPHFRWRAKVELRAQNAEGQVVDRISVPDGAAVGDTFQATVQVRRTIDGRRQRVDEEQTFTVVEHTSWEVYDESQFTYWSGRGNGFIYDRMAEVVCQTIHAISPETPIIVGWGFRWSEDHWAAWDMLYKPTIDATIEWIHGVHEHHYQGDVSAMHGTYEVLTAYGMAAHDKWLYSYNTETNDLLDVPARGHVDTPEKAARATHYRRLNYNMRDILYGVYQTPDKYRSRTVIHLDHTPKATEIAYGLMSDLRGRLVATTSDDEEVWVMASIDGTDPQSPRPEGGHRLVVFVWNDHRDERAVDLQIAAPTGTTLGDGVLEQVTLDEQSWDFDIAQEPAPVVDNAYRLQTTIPGRRPIKISFPLTGSPVEAAEISRRQYFADDILQWIRRDQPWQTTITIPAEELAGARRAWLRCVVESLAEGEALVRIGDQELGIPRAMTGSNVCRIREVPIDLSALGPDNQLTFTVAPGNHAGYLVNMASIVIER